MAQDFTIYRDVPVPIEIKIYHIRKIGGRGRRSFIKDYGDIPIARLNEVTGFWEHVENHRGYAYAVRNHKAYRNKNKTTSQV